MMPWPAYNFLTLHQVGRFGPDLLVRKLALPSALDPEDREAADFSERYLHLSPRKAGAGAR
jgi:hypothetical protein